MFARMGIRIVASLVGIFIGIVVAVAALSGFSATSKAIVVSTLLFWGVNLLVSFVALRILIRQPSVATAGLLTLASTIVSLVIVNLVVSGLKIHGASTYLIATVIIWIATALADMIGRRKIRARRAERRA
jgi:putative membrane protein